MEMLVWQNYSLSSAGVKFDIHGNVTLLYIQTESS